MACIENPQRIYENRVCFAAGTLIHTDKGLKPIEQIHVGQRVLSRSDETFEVEYKPVLNLKRTPEQEIHNIVFNRGGNFETIQATELHPFWHKGEGWLKASLLEAGMKVVDENDVEIEVVSNSKDSELHTVYNFEVDDFHTYFVGENRVWVHNHDCDGVLDTRSNSYCGLDSTGTLYQCGDPEMQRKYEYCSYLAEFDGLANIFLEDDPFMASIFTWLSEPTSDGLWSFNFGQVDENLGPITDPAYFSAVERINEKEAKAAKKAAKEAERERRSEYVLVKDNSPNYGEGYFGGSVGEIEDAVGFYLGNIEGEIPHLSLSYEGSVDNLKWRFSTYGHMFNVYRGRYVENDNADSSTKWGKESEVYWNKTVEKLQKEGGVGLLKLEAIAANDEALFKVLCHVQAYVADQSNYLESEFYRSPQGVVSRMGKRISGFFNSKVQDLKDSGQFFYNDGNYLLAGIAAFMTFPAEMGMGGLATPGDLMQIADPKVREEIGKALSSFWGDPVGSIKKGVNSFEKKSWDEKLKFGLLLASSGIHKLPQTLYKVGKGTVKLGGAGYNIAEAGLTKVKTWKEFRRLMKNADLGDADAAARASLSPQASITRTVVNNKIPNASGNPKSRNFVGAMPRERVDQVLDLLEFDPVANKAYQNLTNVTDRKRFLKEYAKQMDRQIEMLNSMTANELKAAREAFEARKALTKSGRNPQAADAQRVFGDRFAERVENSILESYLKNNRDNLSYVELQAKAKAKASEIKSKLNALHEPDNVIGGFFTPEPSRMGLSSVNKSIGASWNSRVGSPGASWNSRVGSLDAYLDNLISEGLGDKLVNIKYKIKGSD